MAASSSPLDLYESLEVIGTGSFGIIRKVRRKVDGAILACKELNFERMTERDRKQIVAEVNILKDLHHENIVGYYDRYVDRERGVLYILMEYCGGGDLGSVIKGCQKSGKQIPEETIWNYMVQILLALQYCHCPESRQTPPSSVQSAIPTTDKRHQILHRDIKPENIFLDADLTVKLGDFGLSKALSAASTFASTYVGTPYYMSPELIQEKAYDTKVDIWSLGCLIYELCALKPPFHEAQTHQELATFIRNGRIPPLPRGYSQPLTSAIKSMLNINPALRPSAQQLLQLDQVKLTLGHRQLSQQIDSFNTLRQKSAQEVQQREEMCARREKELQDHFLAREAEVQEMVRQKNNEIADKERQMRDAFVKWEEDVKEHQRRLEQGTREREEALRKEVFEWQEHIKTQWELKEGEFQTEIKRLQELLAQKANENASLKKKTEGHVIKNLFRDVGNTIDSSSHETSQPEETPIKPPDSISRGRQRSRFRTPVSFGSKAHSKTLSEPQSAMKGIILTATGEAIPTPQTSHLHNLLNNSPVRNFKGFGKLADEFERVRLEDSPSSPEEARGPLEFQPSPSGPPASRLRRPSIVRSRPAFPAASVATCPTEVPTVGNRKGSLDLHESSQSAPSLERAASSATVLGDGKGRPGVNASAGADTDEDDLPSPFLKRVERAARAGMPSFKPARRTSSEASKALRTAAATNASFGRPPSSKGGSTFIPGAGATVGGRVASAGRKSTPPEDTHP